MKEQAFESFCHQGEEIDRLQAQGDYVKAHRGYLELLDKMNKSSFGDRYLFTKITLSLLTCCLHLGRYKQAFKIWNSTMDDSVYGIGIYALENAQASIEDVILYDFVCAQLHALRGSSQEPAARAVNQYLSRICEHAFEENNRFLLRIAINNWKHHLREIFHGTIPFQYAADLIQAEKAFGETVPMKPVSFPKPGPWKRPQGVFEDSRPLIVKPSA